MRAKVSKQLLDDSTLLDASTPTPPEPVVEPVAEPIVQQIRPVRDALSQAAIKRIQEVLNHDTDPLYLLGKARVREIQLTEALNIAVEELTRLQTVLAEMEASTMAAG